MALTRAQALRDAVLVLLACLTLYWLLRQHTCYGVDAWNDMRRLNGGDSRRLVHLLYMPMADLSARFGSVFGLSLHDSLQLLSNLGSSFGIACSYLALRQFGCPRSSGLWACALMATSPGIVFYATVVERHGPFFGFAGVAMLAAAWWSQRMSGAVRATWFGVSVGLAYAAHSTGVLLLVLLIPLVWVLSSEALSAARKSSMAAIAVVVAALSVEVGNQIGIDVEPTVPGRRDLLSLQIYAAHAIERPDRLPIVLWRELLFPLLPLSWLWVAAFFGRATRSLAYATSIGVVAYGLTAYLILAGFPEAGGMNERGAYLLPLSLPLAWLTVRTFGRTGLVAALVVGVITAFWQVVDHDRRPQFEVAEAVRAELGPDVRPFWLLACRRDFEMLLLEYPDWKAPDPGVVNDYLDMFASALMMEDLAGAESVAPLLPEILVSFVGERPILMTERGRSFLRKPIRATYPHLGPLYLESLEAAFHFVELPRSRVFRLVPR